LRGRRLVRFFFFLCVCLFCDGFPTRFWLGGAVPWLTSHSPGSLCCDSADECKTLIPSLADKISDEELQELLDEMAKLMST